MEQGEAGDQAEGEDGQGEEVEHVEAEEDEEEIAHYELELTPEWRQKLLRTVQSLNSKRRNQARKKVQKANSSNKKSPKQPSSPAVAVKAAPAHVEQDATGAAATTIDDTISVTSPVELYGGELGTELQQIETGLQCRFEQAVRHRHPVEWPATPFAVSSGI
jgi:hypothetical protein